MTRELIALILGSNVLTSFITGWLGRHKQKSQTQEHLSNACRQMIESQALVIETLQARIEALETEVTELRTALDA